jgi:hypothetical protein
LDFSAQLKNCAEQRRLKKAQFFSCADQFSAQFLAAPKTAPNLPKMAGAPYGIYGAPLSTLKSLWRGDKAVILVVGVVLMGMGHQYFIGV